MLAIPQMSKKRYIFTIDDDCFVAQTPSGELQERERERKERERRLGRVDSVTWPLRRRRRQEKTKEENKRKLNLDPLRLSPRSKKKKTGAAINALRQHIRNLCTPSTPHYFNTLYDPYAPGADFVRGFPFSMRSGVPTAISHGEFFFFPFLLLLLHLPLLSPIFLSPRLVTRRNRIP